MTPDPPDVATGQRQDPLQAIQARRAAISRLAPIDEAAGALNLFTRYAGNDPDAITAFVIHAPEDIDLLLTEIRRLRAALATVDHLLRAGTDPEAVRYGIRQVLADPVAGEGER